MSKLLLLLVGVLAFAAADAQEKYPSKPLKIVVPFAPGGSTDIFARLVADKLAVALAQPVVVENRGGASGNIGAEAVAKSPPDGYTLLMATTGVMAINNALYKSISYDAARDFEPVIYIASITNVLIVAVDSPYKNVAELVAAAKQSPGKLTFASAGAGASTHMSAELFKAMAGVDLLHVPYKGSGPAMPDLLSGRVSMMFENMPGAVSYIKSGKMRVLAVTGLKRTPALPDVPTVAEAGADVGLRGYESLSWSGFTVPAGTPRDIVLRLNRETAAIIATAEMKQKLGDQGAEAVGGLPEAFAAHIRSEREKWGRLVRERNIVVN